MTDYYKVLNVSRDASDPDIKRAYRKLAMKWHPDKNADDAECADQKFRAVAEAFEVLIDKRLRATFDRYGEAGLKNGVGSKSGGYRFTSNPCIIFEQFFGTGNPFAEMSFSAGAFDNGFGNPIAPPGTMFGGVKQKVAPAVTKDLVLSLEQLYSGCTARVKTTRKRLVEGSRKYEDNEASLCINVQPGWKRGTRVTFQGEGDEAEGSTTADLVYIVTEAPHDRFERDGDHLYYTAQISLVQALTSCNVEVETLDGRTLSIACNDVQSPTSMKCVPGEGMPVSKCPGQFGDLFIRFNIRFPSSLSPAQQRGIRDIISGGRK